MMTRGWASSGAPSPLQVLRSELRGDHAPVLAAMGPMQFEVVAARMEAEYATPVRLERLGYFVARQVPEAHIAEAGALRGVEVLTRGDGVALALLPDRWRAEAIERLHPDLHLERLPTSAH